MLRRLSLYLLASLSFLQFSVAATELITWEQAGEIFDRYCYECHGDSSTEADLDLVQIDHKTDLAADPEKWTEIYKALRTHYMPHAEGRKMKPDARQQLTHKIRSALLEQAASHDSYSAPLRRLNRTEYSNTLNDLLVLEHNWIDSLPADNAGYGFDNIAAALTLSPLLMQRYFDVANEAALIAVPQKMSPVQWSIAASTFFGGYIYDGSKMLLPNSGDERAAHHRIFFPGKGRYEVIIKLSAQQAGDENARAQVIFDGQPIGTYEVKAGRTDPPDTFKLKLQVQRPGEHEIRVSMVKDFFLEDENGKHDRNLIVHSLDLSGPHQSANDWSSPFLERHFGGAPEGLSLKAIREGIHRFASRAYRRPATEEEVDSLWQVFNANDGSLEDQNVRRGLHAVIDAVLTSPAFLFRFEGDYGNTRESEYALASWLSYFIWSSMPDDRLFQLARKRILSPNIESELARMLDDPRAAALTENFAGQWWHTRDLEIHKPDQSIYEHADRALLDDMREETRLFFQHILEEDRPLLDFLSADYTFVNARLASHYDIEGVKGDAFQKVSLEGTPRRGVWTQGGILTVTSYPNYTSPVIRGQWILENLIGLAPPPPPDNIPSLPGTDGKPDPSDLRASLAAHRDDPDCASCHNIMDPFGLTLEHFDAIGGLRSIAERKKLPEETLFDGEVIGGPVDLANYFETHRSEDFVRNITRKLAIYAAGRGLHWQDEAALDRAARYTQDQDYRFSALIQGLVNEFAPLTKPAKVASVD